MSQEYRVLAAFVRQVQRGLYRRRLLQGGVWLLTLLCTLLLLGIGVQQLIPQVPLAALFYSALAALVLLFLGGYVLLPTLRAVPQRQALLDIEQTYPDVHDDLTNALELDPETLQRANPRGIALDLVRALHHHTVALVQRYSVQTVVQRHRVRGVSWCGALLLTVALATLVQPQWLGESLRLLLTPLSYLPPREIHLTITPQQATIARGTNLEVRAQASGRLPRSMQLLVKRQGQDDKHYPMEPLESGTFHYTFLKPQTSFTFYALAGSSTSPQGRVEVVPAPAIGKMALHYLFPNYTGLPAQTQEGGGDIQALPGTQVRLTMQANVPLTRGMLRFDDGSELPLEVVEGTTLRGEILVMKEATYVVEVEDTHGLKNTQPPRYTVQLLPDRHPSVAIQQPQDGLEVDETTTLQVRYEVEDDFGLQDASLVYFGPAATERRIPLRQGRFDKRQAQETFIWDMQQWPLPAGDTVQFYVEVYDNDTISGPKKGVSQTLTLKVRNREQEHAELKQLQEDMANALLDLLAEHLELGTHFQEWRQQADTGAAPSQETLQQAQEMQQAAMEHAEQIAQRLQEALSRVQRDPYSTYETYADLQALQRNMSYLQHTLLPQLQQSLQALTPQPAPATQLAQPERHLDAVVQELERLSSLAEHVARGEKFNDLMNLSTKMMEQQNKLLAALDNLPRDFQGGELPPEIQQMLDKLDALMRELMDAASQLPTAVADEFLNRQLDSLPLTDMMRQLQEMRQKLAQGDLEGAKKLAEELLKALSTMVAALQNMRQQTQGGSMDAMGQQLQQSSDKLADLVQRQERILDHTQQVDQATLRQLNEAQQQAFDAVQQRLQQELSKLSRLAWDMSRQARQHPNLDAAFQQAYQQLLKQLQTLRQNVEARDMPQAAQDLETAQRQMAWMQRQVERLEPADQGLHQQMAQALEALHAMRQHMHSLPQDRQAMLTPPQRGQLGELAEQQGGVRQDAQELHQAFESLLPLMPFLPTELGKNLQEALPFMADAQDELQGHQSQQAIPPEQQALERLRSAQNSLQQALQQMAQRGQMMGMSMPMLQQAGRLPVPNYMPQPGVDQSSSGVAGASVRNFQLPDKEAYKAPRMFREDITEALKEGYPERFRELIEQYYRHIVR
jgi:hypothetical protein